MANPRQRRKARSSSHRPVSHARNAKRNLKKTPRASPGIIFLVCICHIEQLTSELAIRGPAILSERWDKRKTVRQKWVPISSDPRALRQWRANLLARWAGDPILLAHQVLGRS
jgi:nucleolar protein 16